jgi:2-dehydrotetronate isomerase
MPKFAANLHYLFGEVPFLERFARAAACGFRAVEFQVPYDWPAQQLTGLLARHGLTLALIDTPTGNWQAGDRGLAAVPGRDTEFRAGLLKTIEYARVLKPECVHVLAGVYDPATPYQIAEDTFVANLKDAAAALASIGVAAVIEPINNKMDVVQGGERYVTQGMRGFFLHRVEQAREIIERVASNNLFLHLDLYHQQIMQGNLARTLRDNIAITRHIQFAGVPGRHEPDVGEINYPFLFGLIDELNYRGWVGCEYRPLGRTEEGLGWAATYGIMVDGVQSATHG